jgi:peptidoglycan hydrolase-like protein with peptidoglycan-binding domain
MEYLAYSLMDSSYAEATADTEFSLPEYKLELNWKKQFKSAWLSFASISALLAILSQAQIATAAYTGPGSYYVNTNGSCLVVRRGPSTGYRSVTCYRNGARLPRVVGFRNGFARLSTGYFVSANWISTAPGNRYIPPVSNGVGGRVTLGIGSTGPAVRRVQSILGVPTTGYYGTLTARAVRNFQARNGLLVDGRVGSQTRRALGLNASVGHGNGIGGPVILGIGSTGGAVSNVQRALGVPVSGYYGTTTQRAVRNFQINNGLLVDGRVGPQTRRALGI